MVISDQQAEAFLEQDIQYFANVVEKHVAVPLKPQQKGALISFAYNVGAGAFGKSSVVTYVNKQDFNTAASRLKLYNKGANKKPLAGLTRRRNQEAGLLLS